MKQNTRTTFCLAIVALLVLTQAGCRPSTTPAGDQPSQPKSNWGDSVQEAAGEMDGSSPLGFGLKEVTLEVTGMG